MRIFAIAGIMAAASITTAPTAQANGPGEDRPYQFRSPSHRQVNLNAETLRIQLENGTGVGSSSGIGSQTGNTLNISITGSGDNTIDVGQDNSGDQTIQDSSDAGSNSSSTSRSNRFRFNNEMLN